MAANETNFSVNNSGFFHTGSAIFGQTDPLIEINKNDYIFQRGFHNQSHIICGGIMIVVMKAVRIDKMSIH